MDLTNRKQFQPQSDRSRSALVAGVHDPQLQELIRTALKQNYDLQLAVERVNGRQSPAWYHSVERVSASSLDPNFSGGKTNENIKSTSFHLPGRGVSGDLFGRYRRETKQLGPQLSALRTHNKLWS